MVEQLAALIFSAIDRRRVRRTMKRRLPRIEANIRAARAALEGPDPEAALVFLAMARKACRRAIRASLPKAA